MREVVQQYVTAVRDDLRTNQQNENDRWFGEAHGAAQCLTFLADQGVIEQDTADTIRRELANTVSDPATTPDSKTSKAYTIYKRASLGGS